MRAVDLGTLGEDGYSLLFSSRGWKRHEDRGLLRGLPYPAQCISLDEVKASDSIRIDACRKDEAADENHRHKIHHISNLGNWSFFLSIPVPTQRGVIPAFFDKGTESAHGKLILITHHVAETQIEGLGRITGNPIRKDSPQHLNDQLITIAHKDGSGISVSPIRKDSPQLLEDHESGPRRKGILE